MLGKKIMSGQWRISKKNVHIATGDGKKEAGCRRRDLILLYDAIIQLSRETPVAKFDVLANSGPQNVVFRPLNSRSCLP
jgi:hypothetical protein